MIRNFTDLSNKDRSTNPFPVFKFKKNLFHMFSMYHINVPGYDSMDFSHMEETCCKVSCLVTCRQVLLSPFQLYIHKTEGQNLLIYVMLSL